MTAFEAMERVFNHLAIGDAYAAQQAVLAIEARGSVLPSSMFERVLRAAIEAGALNEEYAAFCIRAYGRATYTAIVQSKEIA